MTAGNTETSTCDATVVTPESMMLSTIWLGITPPRFTWSCL
jgi:hypothetical protein